MSSGDVANAIIDSGVTVGGAGQVYTVAPGQQLAVRAGVNITAITGTMKLYSQVNWYGPTGTFLSTSSGTPVGGTPATTTPLNIVDGGVPGTSFVDNYDGGAPGTAFANSLSGGGVTTAIVTPGSIGPLRLGVAQLADVFTVPVGAGLARVYFIAVSGANGSSMSYYLDGAMVVVGSSSATLPPGYSDNDNPANPQFRWG
jgi:hypothetical protein